MDKDEFLYLEGDELLYIHRKTKKRVKVKDFKTRNLRDAILFDEEYEHALRRWVSHEELIRKDMEIYQILRKSIQMWNLSEWFRVNT